MLQKQITKQEAVAPSVQNEEPEIILRNLKIATKNLIVRVTTLETELKRVDNTQLSIKKMLKEISEKSESLNLEVENKGKYSIYALIENGRKIASFILPNPKLGDAKNDENLPDWLQE